MELSARSTQVATVDGAQVEYRLRPGAATGSDRPAYVVLPGAHMHAGCSFGEQRWLDPEATLLVVSRPGYGRTAVDAGSTPAAFAGRVAGLCRQLGLGPVTALGISMGARTALALAADRPELVRRLVICCGVSFRRWPDAPGRRSGLAMFNPITERLTWAALRTGLRRQRRRFLEIGLASLSTLPPAEAVRRLGDDSGAVVEFLQQCRSRRGFVTDLGAPGPDPTSRVRQPTLVLSTSHDGSVGTEHPEHLARTIEQARWLDLEAPSHLLWWGDRADAFAQELRAFRVS